MCTSLTEQFLDFIQWYQIRRSAWRKTHLCSKSTNKQVLLSLNSQYIYHLPPVRNPSLNCLPRRRALAIIVPAGTIWRIRLSLHRVLGLPCRLVHSRGVHAATLMVHLSSMMLLRYYAGSRYYVCRRVG